MASITIDGQEYDTETLPDEVRSQIENLNFTENLMKRILADIGVYKAAHNAYLSELRDELENNSSS